MNDLDRAFLEALSAVIRRDIGVATLSRIGDCTVHMKQISECHDFLGYGLAMEFTLDFVVFPQLGTWHTKDEREPLPQGYDFEGTAEEEPTALPEVRKQLGEGR